MTNTENPYESPAGSGTLSPDGGPRKTLSLTGSHLKLWVAVAALAVAVAVSACLSYNQIAGTDKTPLHIAAVAVAMSLGPMVGPVANGGLSGGWVGMVPWTAALLVGVTASLAPFAFAGRPVRPTAYWLAWAGYLMMTLLWFASAVLALAFALS